MKTVRFSPNGPRATVWSRNTKLSLLIGGIAALCAAVLLLLYANSLLIPPLDVSWQKKEIPAGDREEKFLLEGKKARLLSEDGKVLWESEKGFRIEDLLLADLDMDGEEEICLLLWKRGKYGKHMPFWTEKNDVFWSQHIFLYDLNPSPDEPVRSKWGASEIGMRVKRWKRISTGREGPAPSEGRSPDLLLIEDEEGNTTVWGWQSFGLKIIDSSVSFIAFGDNLIHKEIIEHGLYRQGGNFDFLYEPFLEDIGNADFAALNVETPLVNDPRLYGGYPSFGTPVEVGEALARAGFDIASCANNHCLDRGMTGIDTGAALYEEKGVVYAGITKSGDEEYTPYRIVSKNGIRFAIFSYTYGTNGNDVSTKYPYAVHVLSEYGSHLSQENTDPGMKNGGGASSGAADAGKTAGITDEQLRTDLRCGKEEADIAVVFMHWGTEYEKEPDEAQRYYARLLNEAGADVVIGSHPHVIQPAEVLKNEKGQETLVAYSLGNFRSAQSSEDTRTGGELCFTAEHTFDGIRITEWEMKQIDAFAK